jgi:hypothetical protein
VPVLITDKPSGAEDLINVLGQSLVYSPGDAINGAMWHNGGAGGSYVEVVWTPGPPLGKTSLTFLGVTATWDYSRGYWIGGTGADSLIVVPMYMGLVAGNLPVTLTRYYAIPDAQPSLGTNYVDLAAALAAGHVVQTGSMDPTDYGYEFWFYVNAEATMSVFPDYPVEAPSGLTTANQTLTSSTTGYAGAKVYIGDFRGDNDNEWIFKKVGSVWVVESTVGYATARNAPDWKIGPELFQNHRGFDYVGVPLDYKQDHIGPEFTGEPDWFKTGDPEGAGGGGDLS